MAFIPVSDTAGRIISPFPWALPFIPKSLRNRRTGNIGIKDGNLFPLTLRGSRKKGGDGRFSDSPFPLTTPITFLTSERLFIGAFSIPGFSCLSLQSALQEPQSKLHSLI